MDLFRRDDGSQIIELSLVILPLLAIVFLILDASWVIFAKASLQYSVREGVRYAVTSQTISGMGQDDSIKTVVQQHAFGFLNNASDLGKIGINYYDPNSLTATNSNAGGNVVEISVDGVSIYPMGPIWRSATAIDLSARSSDVMEGSPGGIPPKR